MPTASTETGLNIEVMIFSGWDDVEKCYYAWSPQFETIRDGETEAEAQAMCREAVEIAIESFAERGTLTSYLAAHGYQPVRNGDGPLISLLDNGTVFHRSSDWDLAAGMPILGCIKVTLIAPLEAGVGG